MSEQNLTPFFSFAVQIGLLEVVEAAAAAVFDDAVRLNVVGVEKSETIFGGKRRRETTFIR